MNRRFSLGMLFIVALVVFGGVAVAVLYVYFSPGEDWILVGPVADFPVSATPYRLDAPPAFIVHLND